MSIIDQMRGEFLAEAEEILDEINSDLLTVEEQGVQSGASVVRKVLRAAHSLKGTSGMFGYEDLSQASHSLEGMLEDLKAGQAADAEAVIEASLDQVEVMRHFLREVVGGPEGATPEPDLEAARGVKPGASVPGPRPGIDNLAPLPENQQFLRIDLASLDSALNLVGDLFLAAALLKDLKWVAWEGAGGRNVLQRQMSTTRLMERRLTELRECLLGMRMVPLAKVFNRLMPAARSVARTRGKRVHLNIEGGDTRLDKALAERLADPLLHLVRNAIDHGIEVPETREQLGKTPEGQVFLSARREGPEVVIEIRDDGRGVDLERVAEKARALGLLPDGRAPEEREILECLFAPGFSTAAEVDTVSGRGVGMDVVRCNITRLSGSVDVHTQAGRGTAISVRVPPTLSTIDGLLVSTSEQMFVLPFYSVVEVLRITDDQRQRAIEEEALAVRDGRVRAVALGPIFGLETNGVRERFAVIVGRDPDRLAILVDRLGQRAEILVKPLGPRLDSLSGLSGVTELADGRVALVLDIRSVMKGVAGIDDPIAEGGRQDSSG